MQPTQFGTAAPPIILPHHTCADTLASSSFSAMTQSPLPHFLATQLQCEAKEKLVWLSPPRHSEC